MKRIRYLFLLIILGCNYEKNDEDTYYNGKLVKQGICMNYVIQVNDINFPQELIEKKWADESSGIEYENVFALESVFDFPENIEENDFFKFKIGNNSKTNCVVCEAYTPVPKKYIKISVKTN